MAISEESDALRGGDVAEGNVYGGELRTQGGVKGRGMLGKTKHPATVCGWVEHGGSN